MRLLRKIVLWVLGIAFGLLALLSGYIAWSIYDLSSDLPDPKNFVADIRSGQPCLKEPVKNFVSLADLSPHLVDAILAAEDKDFFERWPPTYFDIMQTIFKEASYARRGRAPIVSAFAYYTAQCSISHEHHASFNFKRLQLAYTMDRTLSKRQIFELYINQIHLGQNAYGFGSASLTYFGKPAKDLSIAEAAYLAALLKAPSIYSKDLEKGQKGRDSVLDKMVEAGKITLEQAAEAKAQPLQLAVH